MRGGPGRRGGQRGASAGRPGRAELGAGWSAPIQRCWARRAVVGCWLSNPSNYAGLAAAARLSRRVKPLADFGSRGVTPATAGAGLSHCQVVGGRANSLPVRAESLPPGWGRRVQTEQSVIRWRSWFCVVGRCFELPRASSMAFPRLASLRPAAGGGGDRSGWRMARGPPAWRAPSLRSAGGMMAGSVSCCNSRQLHRPASSRTWWPTQAGHDRGPQAPGAGRGAFRP